MNDDDVMGVFMGLESSSHEYVAWLIAPYKPDFAVEIGSLLLIQNVRDHIVARVMDYAPRGEFVSAMGEKWLNDIASDGALDAVGLDIKRSKVSYKVRIKVLGSLSEDGFLPGLRRIPQITSKVRLPNKITLEKIIGAAMKEQSAGVHIGYYDMDPSIQITFDQKELNSKRTFIFARAGYGKSNLMKVICSEWKKENGGLLVFDQEGEYAITDRKGRPGIMDRRSALLITNQKMPPGIKNIYPNTGLNLTELPPGLAVPILVNPDKHGTIFFAKLMSMGRESWPLLVELLRKDGWDADYNDVGRIVQGTRFGDNISKIPSEVDIKPILNNLVPGIRKIHDPDSKMISIIGKALRQGQVVIFDISRTDAHTARLVSSIIIKNIFEDNKNNFIRYGGRQPHQGNLRSRGGAHGAFGFRTLFRAVCVRRSGQGGQKIQPRWDIHNTATWKHTGRDSKPGRQFLCISSSQQGGFELPVTSQRPLFGRHNHADTERAGARQELHVDIAPAIRDTNQGCEF